MEKEGDRDVVRERSLQLCAGICLNKQCLEDRVQWRASLLMARFARFFLGTESETMVVNQAPAVAQETGDSR